MHIYQGKQIGLKHKTSSLILAADESHSNPLHSLQEKFDNL